MKQKRLMQNKTKTTLLLLSLLMGALMVGVVTVPVLAQSPSAISDGSFTLNSAPDVADVDFQTDAYVTDEALDPDAVTYQRLNFTLTSSAGLDDILNATIYIFEDSTHGATYNTSAPDGLLLVEYMWTEATNTFTVVDQGALSEWSIDSATSDKPADTSLVTTYEFSMRFQISRAARAATTDWNASVHVYDDDGSPEMDIDSEPTLVTMNSYFELEFSSSTFTWGSDVQPSSVNNSITAGVTITVYANAQWEITLSATDFNATAESDVDIEANDIVSWDHDGSAGGDSLWIRNTPATMVDTWDNQAPMSTESGFNRDFYVYLSPGVFFVVGKEWQFAVTATCQADT